jgi:RHS repeat-associated protein
MYYDGPNLIQEGPQSSTAEKLYIHGGRLDELVASYRWGWDLAYYHYDARGHCTLLTNSSGDVREQYDYDAFGFPYFYDAAGNNIGYSLYANRFLFTGREWLSDLKLYDYRARLYNPELGRFMQPDPKEFAAGDYNLYRYCHNDPVNRSDPFGLIDREIDKDLDKKGVEASQNALKAAKDAGDHAGRSQAVQEKDGKRSLASKIAKGSPKTEKRMIGGRMQTVTTQTEEAPVDPGHTPVGVGHVHMDKTGKGDPNFSKADKDTARGSKGEPGIPVYKVNESNPSQILRLTPQVDYHDEPTIRPVP